MLGTAVLPYRVSDCPGGDNTYVVGDSGVSLGRLVYYPNAVDEVFIEVSCFEEAAILPQKKNTRRRSSQCQGSKQLRSAPLMPASMGSIPHGFPTSRFLGQPSKCF